MTFISSINRGHLRCESEHQKSGSSIETDAPTDNHGKGERFSPTDLLATSLITCMLTVMDIHASKIGIDISGSHGEIEKIMISNPRRIHQLKVHLQMHGIEKEKDRVKLEKIGRECPVALSLHSDLEQSYQFTYH